MTRKILLLVLIACSLLTHAQLKLNPAKLDGSGPMEFIKPDADQSDNKIRIYKFDAATNALKNVDESYKGLKKLLSDNKNFTSLNAAGSLLLFWEIAENKVTFYLNPQGNNDNSLKNKSKVTLYYCKGSDSFQYKRK